MTDLFQKEMRTVTRDDIQCLIDKSYPEGDSLEFKQTLPSRHDSPDPWILGQDRIGDYARNKLLEEILAFANAHGGHLIIGIEESSSRPHRAQRITGVPRCHELVEKLRLQIRDCVDPHLPVIEIASVLTSDDGSGVIIIRVPQSRAAPHRVTTTLNCSVRHADRCEKMTMREIQDLTLQRDRYLHKIDELYIFQRENFKNVVASYTKSKLSSDAIAIRSTLIPIGAPLFITKVYKNPDVGPEYTVFDVQVGKGRICLKLPQISRASRAILRGAKYEYNGKDFYLNSEVHCDGLIEYSLISPIEDKKESILYPEWVLGLALNSILTAHKFRRTAGAPGCEYGIEIDVCRTGGALHLGRFGSGMPWEAVGAMERNPLLLPRVSFGATEEIPTIMALIERDLFNSAGADISDEVWKIDIPAGLID